MRFVRKHQFIDRETFQENVLFCDNFLGSRLTVGSGQPCHENSTGGGDSRAGVCHSAPWAAPQTAPQTQDLPALCVMPLVSWAGEDA